MEVIVKYANRKLYSKTLSKYVTLDYILDLARDKNQVFSVKKYTKNVDVSKMQDITGEVLSESLTKLNTSPEKLVGFIRSL